MTEASKDLNKLVRYISTLEGKKHEASIGDIREILKIVAGADSCGEFSSNSPLSILRDYTNQVAAKKARKK